ncbi:MAG: hypothetical protein H7840_02630 [Alphaproteobacteria bacterium]
MDDASTSLMETEISSISAILSRLEPRVAEMHGFITATMPHLVTRTELAEARADIRSEALALRSESKSDLAGLRSEIRDEITALRTELKEDLRAINERLLAIADSKPASRAGRPTPRGVWYLAAIVTAALLVASFAYVGEVVHVWQRDLVCSPGAR